MDIINTVLTSLKFPEGPVFDHRGNLWFVEIKGGNLACWDGKTLQRFDVDGTPNSAMVDKAGNIWFCDAARAEIRTFSPSTNTFATVCNQLNNGSMLVRPNDLIFDSEGNLLFSDHADGREQPLSTICVLPKGENMARVISANKRFTNGLALNANGTTLIFSETYNQQLWVGHWDAKRIEFTNERPFAKTGKGPWGPDGIAFDKNENLYVTIFNESCLNVYSPSGEIINTITLPGSRPTSCAFDPSGKLGLVVTEADRGEIYSLPELGAGLPIFYR